MTAEFIYYREEGLEFLIHFYEDGMHFDTDYMDNLLILDCGQEFVII